MVILVSIAALLLCGVLYLFLIMPRVFGKPDTKAFDVLLYAHRGLHDNEGDAPENSINAFRRAVEAGYGIELDIQLSKDKIPVVFHDNTLNRICGVEGKVSDFTFRELEQFTLCHSSEKIPRFSEILKLVDGRVPLIVELKGDGVDLSLCPIADKMLREYKGAYCIESFNPLMVGWYRKNHPEIMRGQLAEKLFSKGKKRSVLNFVLEHLLLNFYAKPDFIAYYHKHHDNLSRRIVTRLFGNISVAYTIKSQAEYEAAKKHFEWFIFDSFIPE